MSNNKVRALVMAGILAAGLGACSAPESESPGSTSQEESGASPGQEGEKRDETVAQANARESAESYLDTQAFSRKGLIEQLKFEGFSKKDATYGVDALDVNWREQAAKQAESYLETDSFSHKGLIEQLEFEGFTEKQATYGVDALDVNWSEQAAKKAESYLETDSFSRKSLIDQLKFEGFTEKQAEYGADAVGL